MPKMSTHTFEFTFNHAGKKQQASGCRFVNKSHESVPDFRVPIADGKEKGGGHGRTFTYYHIRDPKSKQKLGWFPLKGTDDGVAEAIAKVLEKQQLTLAMY